MHSPGGCYWISDIADVHAKMNDLEAQLGSFERLAEFRTERKKLVENANNVSEKYKLRTWSLFISLSGRGTMQT